MLTALMDGRAVSELAAAAGVTIQTASGHLSKLDAANLLVAEKQGRHRYFRLSGTDVAQVLEGLMGLAQQPVPCGFALVLRTMRYVRHEFVTIIWQANVALKCSTHPTGLV